MPTVPVSADAIIVGGGPSGSAAAIGLARAGARVLLLERESAARFKPGEILEPTIKYPLNQLGLSDRFENLDHLPIAGNVSLWGTADPVESDGMLNPHGCGYLVDRARMEQWLIAEAQRAGVVVRRGRCRIHVGEGSPRVVAWAEEGRRCEAYAPIVVDATGRGPGIVGPGTRQRFDALVALLAYVADAPERPRDQRLYIEAAADGWWYSAVLPDSRTVLAFMTDADLVPSGTERRVELFRHRLAQTRITRRRVADLGRVTTVRTCPAMSTMRTVVSGSGWVAIGDAASTYDPLSGRGVAAALSKGTALARLIAATGDLARAGREYAEAEAASYEDYLAMYRSTYARERRWPASAFWKRRQ